MVLDVLEMRGMFDLRMIVKTQSSFSVSLSLLVIKIVKSYSPCFTVALFLCYIFILRVCLCASITDCPRISHTNAG